ncbi:hypothetical protein KP509_20G035600 [Ceratopteris richardii]|uniref:CBS domain-containing protein n=1 Tax=Ceratopteris richardii TaxID=49495 RepID=A0A8T2SHG9_CERRI|nr:hypothetical protein KP509_20G035600 [Ceratopteris richardii]
MDFSSKKYVKHLSMRVEQLWESVSLLPIPQEEKLNACFDKITVSLFPPMERGEVIEMSSDTSLAEAVHILATNQILSAPVWDVDALEDASWIDKYLGLIEFEGIVHWILHQAEILTTGRVVTGAERVETSDNVASEAHVTGKSGDSTLPPVHSAGEAAVTGSAPLTVGGAFFEELTSSDLYRSTKVKDIAGSFRWAPFIPIQNSDTFLTLLLLLSKYRVKCLPLVESGEGRIDNFITQSSVIHMLSECTDFPWFESLGAKSLSEIGLPCMTTDKLAKVEEDQPVLQAFQLMCQRGIGAVPVVSKGGSHIVGNVSMRDIQFLLVVPEMYKTSRFMHIHISIYHF